MLGSIRDLDGDRRRPSGSDGETVPRVAQLVESMAARRCRLKYSTKQTLLIPSARRSWAHTPPTLPALALTARLRGRHINASSRTPPNQTEGGGEPLFQASMHSSSLDSGQHPILVLYSPRRREFDVRYLRGSLPAVVRVDRVAGRTAAERRNQHPYLIRACTRPDREEWSTRTAGTWRQ